jgi:hypothetical protein
MPKNIVNLQIRYRLGAWLLLTSLVSILFACTPSNDVEGVRLVSESTVTSVSDALLPTLIVTNTPVRTPERPSPLQQVTVDADFVLVTPTLPPSKTPTQTPTHTMTPTVSPTPTITTSPDATAFLFPTSVIVPITQAVAAPIDQVCDSSWFWIQPRPASCPLNLPTASQGVFQQFQNGYMVWVEHVDLIYVMYNDGQLPRWEAQRDYFNEGMTEESSEFDSAPAPNLWQPRRGFGLLWRTNATIRNRIGWAVQEWEQPYSVQVQRATDGTIYVSQPAGSAVFALFTSGNNWDQYIIDNNAPPIGATPNAAPIISPGGVPFPTPRPPGL